MGRRSLALGRVGVAAVMLAQWACGGDDGSSEAGAGTGGNGGNGPANSGDEGAGCEGQPAPEPPEGFTGFTFFGDVEFIHEDDRDVQALSLSSGEMTPLFELEEPETVYENSVVADARDVFAVSEAGIWRFDRATEELTLFTANPEPGSDPALPDEPWLNGNIAVSETHVFATVVNLGGYDFDTALYDQAALMIYDRASAESRVVALDTSVEGTMRLAAHADRFFHIRAIDQRPEPGVAQFSGEIQSYDVETGTSELLISSAGSFPRAAYDFAAGFVYAAISNEESEQPVVRAPAAGGAPEEIYPDTRERDIAVLGDKLYLVDAFPGDDGVFRDQLVELDLTSLESRPFGGEGCRALPVHASDSTLYVYDLTADERLRMQP